MYVCLDVCVACCMQMDTPIYLYTLWTNENVCKTARIKTMAHAILSAV